jgi:hypothetical protein
MTVWKVVLQQQLKWRLLTLTVEILLMLAVQFEKILLKLMWIALPMELHMTPETGANPGIEGIFST